jgi:hypothetical protein
LAPLKAGFIRFDTEKVVFNFSRKKARRAYVFGRAEQRVKAPLTQCARPAALRPGYPAL